ncbi:MAG TPA: ABC transporter substrate-binding protein [Beijerinckiaceae bacterium]|nr:ABC transporter substrate-binding protein [Beijerinckiaceae bacterium]
MIASAMLPSSQGRPARGATKPSLLRGLRLECVAAAFLAMTAVASAADIRLIDPPFFKERVEKQQLPEIAQRVPKQPLVADLEARGRVPGRHGGDIRTLVSAVRDLRYVTVYGYTRLIGYTEKLELKPDLLADIEIEGGRVFTLTLREGHRWSDGKPFTTEDFRYYWEDMANDKSIAPAGPPEVYFVDGQLPKFEVLDERRVRFTWSKPNERLLPFWAQPGKVFSYAPAHYLKQFHAKYTPEADLKKRIADAKVRSWAALHNRMDDPYENGNVDMPVLGPWRVLTKGPASRYVFERNPYYHRIDREGRQLPYVDRILVDIAAGGLIAAKANAGETDLQGRGLSMVDAGVLKEGEKLNGYRTLLWPNARGSAYALYPNLNTADPEFKKLNRDLRWRRALSHAIDRRMLNNALLFGLGREVGNTVEPQSPLYSEAAAKMHMAYDPALANRLLDEIGLTQRDSLGFRLLPDGRRLELLVELNGGDGDMLDALQLIAETWADIGIKLIAKPQDRSILRKRSYSGQTVMVMSTGLDNAVPTADMPPIELAPAVQDNYAWPMWGQHVETKGKSGEPADIPAAKALLDDYTAWRSTNDPAQKTAIWKRMIENYAANLWTIGTVSGELQPVVVSKKLRNVPDKAVFAWEPMALFGVHRIDEFFYAE